MDTTNKNIIENAIDSDFLFEMTKNGIFSLILKCDKEIDDYSGEVVSQILKVS